MRHKLCAVNPALNHYVFGDNKTQIVSKIVKWELDENRVLSAQARGYPKHTYHSYGEEYTEEEVFADVINFLFDKLFSDFNYSTFLNTEKARVI